jgi:hypothetical protein
MWWLLAMALKERESGDSQEDGRIVYKRASI